MSFSDDPADKIIKNLAKGTAEAGIEYTERKIKELVKNFLNRKLSFVEDPETIEKIKKQRKKAEWKQFKDYVKDKDLRILFQMGLTLRDGEKGGIDYLPLIKKIRRKYDKWGVHVAWFIQNGLFNKYLSIVIETDLTSEQIQKKIESFLKEIDDNTSFISEKDKKEIDIKVSEIVTKIQAHSPDIFIVSSMGEAMQACDKIIEDVSKKLSDYSCDIYDSPQKGRKIYFLISLESNLL